MVKEKTTKKRTPVTGQAASRKTTALHAANKDGKTHAVSILNLRVLIKQDGDFWVAQGLEVDYAAYGKSVDIAKSRFESGLRSTIHHNLESFGGILNVLRVAPDDIWMDYWKGGKASQKIYSQLSIHEIPPCESIGVERKGPRFNEVQIEYGIAA